MDIADFLERFAGSKLPEWQKEHIRMLYEMSRDRPIYISMRPHQGRDAFYTYLKQNTLRELTQSGKTLDSNKEMPVMRKEC